MNQNRMIIDGHDCEFQQGETILAVATRHNINIPTLCFYKRLNSIGSCRMCVVEIEGYAMPMAACTTPAVDGISVITNSDRLFRMRQDALKLILVNHPLDCPVCDKAGECMLQDLTFEYGITAVDYKVPKQKFTSAYQTTFIQHFPERCILCLRCINVCTEIQGIGALSIQQTENGTQIGFDKDKCVSCGECVQACPVGGMLEKKSKYRWRSWEVNKTIRTTCPYCGVGCQQLLHVKNGKIVKVTGFEDGSPNKGRLCVKGRYGFDFIYSDERLKTPLIRENGKLRPASWDEALDLVANKFTRIIKDHGADALAGVSCARSINEDSYQMQKLFRSVFKTNNIDHCART